MRVLTTRRAVWIFALMFILLVGNASVAMADPIFEIFVLKVGNDTSGSNSTPPTGIISLANGNGYYGPYGSVSLNLLSTGKIQVTVDIFDGYAIFGSKAFGFNLAGTLTPADINVSLNTGGYNIPKPNQLGGQMDGFGTFQYTIGDGNAPGHTGPGALVFTVEKKVGTFSSVFEIVELSSGTTLGGYGNFAAQVGKLDQSGKAFVLPITNPDGSVTSGTGFARDGERTQVPEPGFLAFLGTGLLAAGSIIRRFYRAK